MATSDSGRQINQFTCTKGKEEGGIKQVQYLAQPSRSARGSLLAWLTEDSQLCVMAASSFYVSSRKVVAIFLRSFS